MIRKLRMPEYLSAVERKVIAKVQTGEEMIFSAPTPEQLADPTFVATMPVISARVIRSLCVGEWKDISLHTKGVRITGARILEPLDLEFSTLLYPLELSRCQFDETVVLKNATAMAIRFYGSRATKGIDADELHVNGCLSLSHGFTTTAPVSLLGASISGDLDLREAYLDHPNDYAMSTDGANVGGNVFLRDGFTANGTVRLLGASIGGDLDLNDAHLNTPNGEALSADRVNVKGGIFLSGTFTANGEIRLLGASISGNLDLSNASRASSDTNALSADGMNVKGEVFLRGTSQLRGQYVYLVPLLAVISTCGEPTLTPQVVVLYWLIELLSRIDIYLMEGFTASFNNASQTALLLVGATIDSVFRLQETHIQGMMDLSHCRVRRLDDDRKSWPAAEDLNLNGFSYDSFSHNAPCTAAERLEWLRRQCLDEAFYPQSYEQAIRVLRTMGYDAEAREIAIAKQIDLRKYGRLGVWGWLKNFFLEMTVGYGYRPWLGLVWLAGLIGCGWFVFHVANHRAKKGSLLFHSISKATSFL